MVQLVQMLIKLAEKQRLKRPFEFSVFYCFTEMLAEIENRLFVGGPDKKGNNPVYCLNSLDSRFFRCAVEIIVCFL